MTPRVKKGVAVCIKWVDARPEVDPLTGEVRTDTRTSGASDADNAALEWALRAAAQWDTTVTALTAGPPDAEAVLHAARAAGAHDAVRVALSESAPSDTVAASLCGALPEGTGLVICGAWSVDRGSGSVPAFMAARLSAAQALGLIDVAFDKTRVTGQRRLDRGRRERISTRLPAVISVEAGSARLRRASLSSILHEPASVPVVAGVGFAPQATRVVPMRPRALVLAAPSADLTARERILALTGALTDRTPPQRLVLDPPDAADRIVAQLETWGYL